MNMFFVGFFMCLISSIVFSAMPLSQMELNRLSVYELNQSVCVESYTDTDKGVATVFGYHFDAFLSENYFLGMAIYGAVGGERGGYGIASLGGGRREKVGKGFVDARLLLGSGGGGGFAAGGGFSVFPEFGGYYPIFKQSLYSFGRVGYLWFPGGDFHSPTLSFGLTYRYNVPFLPVEVVK